MILFCQRTVLEKIDKPPDFKEIVLKSDPPCYLSATMNEQINPVINKNWAQALHERTVSPEVDEAVSRSRAASICSIDPHWQTRLANHSMVVPAQGGGGHLLAVPSYLGGSRRATLANIHQNFDGHSRGGRRARTMSMSPPVGTMWIGV